jgi:hypothetical protein
MALASSQDAAAVFYPLQPLLIRVAYRMLGSVADAEDVVQDCRSTRNLHGRTQNASCDLAAGVGTRIAAGGGYGQPS